MVCLLCPLPFILYKWLFTVSRNLQVFMIKKILSFYDQLRNTDPLPKRLPDRYRHLLIRQLYLRVCTDLSFLIVIINYYCQVSSLSSFVVYRTKDSSFGFCHKGITPINNSVVKLDVEFYRTIFVWSVNQFI